MAIFSLFAVIDARNVCAIKMSHTAQRYRNAFIFLTNHNFDFLLVPLIICSIVSHISSGICLRPLNSPANDRNSPPSRVTVCNTGRVSLTKIK